MAGIPLYKLDETESGTVISVETDGKTEVQQRLTDLGIIPGTKIRCLYRSPLKDPTAYEIRSTVVALRKEDSAGILVNPDPKEKGDNLTIALAGNPNVGKSTIFNCLTGMRQHTGNWSGKTVELASGTWKIGERRILLTDIPGCYSLNSQSPEEEVARSYLQSGTCSGVIVICDGTCLERNLILVLQILQLTSHVGVCVSMMDQVRRRGLSVDGALLSRLLGVPVCMTESGKPKEMRAALEHLVQMCSWENRTDEIPLRASATSEQTVREAEAIAERTVSRSEETKDAGRAADRILTRPFTGFAAMAAMVFLVFWITLTGAGWISDLFSRLLFAAEAPLYHLLRNGIGLPQWFCEMMVYGMYRVLAWVVSVMFPPMAIFFPLFTILEDWGFLPRVAFNLDRCFHCCRACGKQALTMCMGFGCNASAVVGCRIITSRRERLLAMLTNSLVPCNGRFPLLIFIIGYFFCGGTEGVKAALLLTVCILSGVGATFLLSKILSMTLLRGEPSAFVLELPPFRRPQIRKILIRSLLDRTVFVLGRAVSVAAPAGLLIWILANVPADISAGPGTEGGTSLLCAAASLLDPAGQLMGMDGVILLSFLLGFPASEIVLPVMMMIYMNQGTLTEISDMNFFYTFLTENGWTWITGLNVIIFSLMHWPCAAALLSIRKESGSWKWAAVAALAPLAVGIPLCTFVTALTCKIL